MDFRQNQVAYLNFLKRACKQREGMASMTQLSKMYAQLFIFTNVLCSNALLY